MRHNLDIAIVLSIGFVIGWLWSSLEIMEHCDLVGGFHVFGYVYECTPAGETK
jgi:hypothetical protein